MGGLELVTERGRYRPCAGSVVFNKEGMYLVGERITVKGSWQFPQGGIEEGETPMDAAKREMYEEVGLSVPGGAVVEVCTIEDAMLYNVDGGWLKKEGYCGQAMYFSLFYYPGEGLPPVNLGGLGGEKPEFSQVKWAGMKEVVEMIWVKKRAVYEELAAAAVPKVEAYLTKVRQESNP